jgi:hypothetical protein
MHGKPVVARCRKTVKCPDCDGSGVKVTCSIHGCEMFDQSGIFKDPAKIYPNWPKERFWMCPRCIVSEHGYSFSSMRGK